MIQVHNVTEREANRNKTVCCSFVFFCQITVDESQCRRTKNVEPIRAQAFAAVLEPFGSFLISQIQLLWKKSSRAQRNVNQTLHSTVFFIQRLKKEQRSVLLTP